MSRTIKGITVEIGGNTTKLDKALKDVNKTLKDTKSELSAVEKGLKLDPSNVTLLKQKQEVLNEAISASKDKLSQLEAVQSQVTAAFKRGEIGGDQYRAFAREVEASKAQLKDLQGQQRETNKAINDLPISKTDSLSGALEKVKTKLSTIDTSAKGVVKGLGAGLATVTKEAAKAAAEVAKVAGEVAKIEAKAVQKAAGAFSDYVKVVTGAATALGGVSLVAGAAADDLNTLSKQTGISTEELQKLSYASDIIDVDVSTVAGSLAKLTRNMSGAEDETGAAAEAFAALGVSVTDQNGQLRNNQEVFSEVISALGNIENSTQRDAYAMAIFGKSAQELNPLIIDGVDVLNQLGNAADEAGLIMDQSMLDSLNSLNDSFDILKGNASAAGKIIGATFAGDLENLLGTVGDAIPELSTSFAGLFDPDTFEKSNADFQKTLKTLLDNILKWIKTSLPSFLQGLNAVLVSLIQGVAAVLPSLIRDVLPVLLTSFVELVQTLVSEIPTILPYVIEGAKMLFQGLISGLDEVVVMLVEMLPSLVDQVCSALTDCAPMLLESGLQALVALLNGIADNTEKIVDTVSALIPVFVDTISQNLPKILDAGLRIITELATGILDNLDVILPAVLQLMIAIPAAVIKELPRVLESGKDILGALANGLVETFEPVSSKLSEIIEKIVDFFKGLWDKFKQIGKDIIGGIAAGLEEAADVVTGTFEDFGDNWVTGIKDIFGIASPSKVMRDQVGKYMAEGIAVGFEDEMKSVSGAMQSAIPRDFDTDVNIGANISGSASAARSAASTGGTFGGQQEIVLVLADTAGNVLARSIAGPLDAIQGARVMMAQEGMAI